MSEERIFIPTGQEVDAAVSSSVRYVKDLDELNAIGAENVPLNSLFIVKTDDPVTDDTVDSLYHSNGREWVPTGKNGAIADGSIVRLYRQNPPAVTYATGISKFTDGVGSQMRFLDAKIVARDDSDAYKQHPELYGKMLILD